MSNIYSKKCSQILSLIALLLATVAASHQIQADESDSASQEGGGWQLSVAAGYGQRSNPLIDSENLLILGAIQVSWFGNRWFYDDGDLGYTIEDNQHFTVNVIAQPNTERLFFENSSSVFSMISSTTFNDSTSTTSGGSSVGDDSVGGTPNEPPSGQESNQPSTTTEIVVNESSTRLLPDRSVAWETGLEFLTETRWGFVQASWLQDISQKHNGYSANIRIGRSGFWHRWTWSTHIEARYRSRQLNNYYYGILESEATEELLAYRAKSGINWITGAAFRYHLSKKLNIGFVAQYERLSDAIIDSPIIVREEIATGFMGLQYKF